MTDSFEFLRPGGNPVTDVASLGSFTNVTGALGTQYRVCTEFDTTTIPIGCDQQSRMREFDGYTRVLVTYDRATTSVNSRLTVDGFGFGLFPPPAPGTLANRTGGFQSYATSETGFSTFTNHSQF